MRDIRPAQAARAGDTPPVPSLPEVHGSVAIPRELLRAILEGIQRLRLPTPLPG